MSRRFRALGILAATECCPNNGKKQIKIEKRIADVNQLSRTRCESRASQQTNLGICSIRPSDGCDYEFGPLQIWCFVNKKIFRQNVRWLYKAERRINQFRYEISQNESQLLFFFERFYPFDNLLVFLSWCWRCATIGIIFYIQETQMGFDQFVLRQTLEIINYSDKCKGKILMSRVFDVMSVSYLSICEFSISVLNLSWIAVFSLDLNMSVISWDRRLLDMELLIKKEVFLFKLIGSEFCLDSNLLK